MKLSNPDNLLKTITFFLLTLMLSACEGEINTNENAFGDVPSPISNDADNNDDYFHATILTKEVLRTDSLSGEDMVDYFVVYMGSQVYKTYTIDLINLSGEGNADIELMSEYSNRLSWSDNEGAEPDTIKYWRGYTKSEGEIVYIRVINRSGTDISYSLEVN